MGKAHGAVLLSGRIHNLIYRVRDGRNIVHLAPDEIHVRNASDRYYGNRIEFGGAATMAFQVYQGLKSANEDAFGPVFRGYAQNHLTARIRNARHKHRVHIVGEKPEYANEFRFHQVAPVLKGLDLSRDEAPSRLVNMTPVGPQHNPTAIKITGLERAARAVPTLGNARLEFRIHMRQAEIKDIHYCPDAKEWHEEDLVVRTPELIKTCTGRTTKWYPPSDWIPTEIIPTEGLTLPIPELLDSYPLRYLTAIIIEWREIRTVGRRIIQHHHHGIVRIAALHAPAEAWVPARSESHQHATHHLTPCQKSPAIRWQMDPKAYLTAALAKIFSQEGPPPKRV